MHSDPATRTDADRSHGFDGRSALDDGVVAQLDFSAGERMDLDRRATGVQGYPLAEYDAPAAVDPEAPKDLGAWTDARAVSELVRDPAATRHVAHSSDEALA
jgi:hypothetical protein